MTHYKKKKTMHVHIEVFWENNTTACLYLYNLYEFLSDFMCISYIQEMLLTDLKNKNHTKNSKI